MKIHRIFNKTTVLINNKIKAGKGKNNKKKELCLWGPVIKVYSKTKEGLYDLLKEENKGNGSVNEEDYDYRGNNDELGFL